MLDYARQRATEALRAPRSAVLATSGPAGLLLGEFACEAVELSLYLLVPRTSDHLYNLEHAADVAVLTPQWELRGEARALTGDAPDAGPALLRDAAAAWCVLVRVEPRRLQIRGGSEWGRSETIDLTRP